MAESTSTPIHIQYKWDASDMAAELEAMTLDELGTKKIRTAIRAELKKAREDVMDSAKSALSNDPRNSYRAVRKIVYKKGLGGVISLYNRKKAGAKGNLISNSKGGRSGIIRVRHIGEKTKRMNSYMGCDRAFILRWIEGGTGSRYNKTVRYASRGSIRPRPFFKSASERALKDASERLNIRLEKMIQRVVKQRKKAASQLN